MSITNLFKDEKAEKYAIIAVCVLVIVIAIIIYKKSKDWKSLIKDKNNEQELIDMANQNMIGSDITLTQEEFDSLCKRLYRAMKGRGTDEEAIWDVYERMNTRSDVLQLNKTYGTVEGETLKEWLYDDLTSDEIMHLNSILSNKGINYRY